MKIFTLGATGNIGQRFVDLALARGHDIRAVVRPGPHIVPRLRLDVIEADVLDPSSITQAMRGTDAVVCCLGIRKENQSDPWSPLLSPENFMEHCAKNIVAAMKENRLTRLVAISSAGIGDSWDSVDPDLQAVIQSSNINKVFQDLENMERVLTHSNLDTLAVRPVALANGDQTGSAQIVDAFHKTSRITYSDVALWILDAIERPEPFTLRTEMIGTQTQA